MNFWFVFESLRLMVGRSQSLQTLLLHQNSSNWDVYLDIEMYIQISNILNSFIICTVFRYFMITLFIYFIVKDRCLKWDKASNQQKLIVYNYYIVKVSTKLISLWQIHPYLPCCHPVHLTQKYNWSGKSTADETAEKHNKLKVGSNLVANWIFNKLCTVY